VNDDQIPMVLAAEDDLTSEAQEYNPTPIINRIRTHLKGWRSLKNQADWGVTPATARLLAHWRQHNFEDVRPFFCQIEAVETIISLTEVARTNRRQYGDIWEHILGANEQANRELARLAMKMAMAAASPPSWPC
jgi:type III restriction enzyme